MTGAGEEDESLPLSFALTTSSLTVKRLSRSTCDPLGGQPQHLHVGDTQLPAHVLRSGPEAQKAMSALARL